VSVWLSGIALITFLYIFIYLLETVEFLCVFIVIDCNAVSICSLLLLLHS